MHNNSTVSRILIIEDDEDDFFLISEYIKNIPGCNFIIEWSFDYKEALEYIGDGKYDLYIVDYYLGAKTGLDFIKDAVKRSDAPIILLTGKGNHNIDMEAIQAGAVDYLVKNELGTEKLERSIRHSLQRSKAIKALRANEIKYRHIFENSLNAIFLTDEQLVFLDVNPATTELLECSREALIHTSFYSFLSPAYDQKALQEKLAMNGDIKEEIELITTSGDMRYCLLSFSNEVDSSGQSYLQGIAQDISNLRREERRKIHRGKLDIADRISRVLAHEVRNPLNNIDLAAGQLAEEKNEDTARMYLEIINRNSKRIADLITELLRATPNVILTKSDLQQIVEESINVAKDRIMLKRIKLSAHYPQESITIQADQSKLKIAFLNIIINATEAMLPGEGELTVTVKKENGVPVVTILDNGCGIKKENIPHLFEAYYTDKKNGLGLGLSATYNIITLHNGSLEVTSKIGEGTQFVISIPVS